MRLARTLTFTAAVVTVIGLPAASHAAAQRDQLRHPLTHSFEGTCAVEGTVHFTPPATAFQQLLSVTYAATGKCSGTVDGQSVSDAPVTMHNAMQSDGSCAYARTVAPGEGALTFDGGPSISYTVEFLYVGTEGVQSFRGSPSGSALGHGSFLTPNSSPEAGAGCVNGQGVPELLMDITLATQSPLTSAARQPRR
jgi:hypothetical protein